MKNKRMSRWLPMLMVLMLVVLAGCQSVSGVDLNKVIQNSVSTKSSQGTQTLTLELIRNSSAKLSDDEQRMLDLFSNVKLNITDMRQQDATHVSIKGAFEYNKGKIPFLMVMSEQDYIITVEGANKPIVLHNSVAAMDQIQDQLSQEMKEQIKQLYKKSAEMAPSFAAYFGGNLPNPKNITIFDAREYVNNEGLNLKRIHAEIKGDELADLIKGFLTNLLKDEKGMKDILGQLYDLVLPLVQQAMKESKAQGGSPMDDMIAPYLNNKTLAVEFAFTFLQTKLKELVDSYDQSLQAALSSSNGGKGLQTLLSDKQYAKFDLYVDSDLMPRKSSTEIMITVPDSADEAISGIKITSTQDIWNINKPVTVETINTSGGLLEMNSLSKPSKILAALDPKSQLYQLLKYDLHITKKQINLFMDDYSYDESTKPYISHDVTMVPVRFVVEQLESDVAWDAATKQVTITDPVSGAIIKLNVGSKQASVNGTIKSLETEAELTNGTTFVPVRFIAESMGAKVEWNQELKMVTITRD
ncbi:copper amine oxidase N-terminal domain-containing protein [Paenibacillus sp. UNC451MF]|uniref:copper amine oxidase N-terminal domain-containing protein n=1 Tax=Paenibacillus sp. UNC451MF TaxID=1449063 RepID=UPI00048C9C71|nr:copper amine oxidase N-terminal domain-containing protein [Paenibacillus sp. UNC451MF]